MTLTTVALAFITFFYLLETKKQRALLEQTVAVDTQPKVFIKTLDTRATPDFKNNRIIIHTNLLLSNCGRTEARNIRMFSRIAQGNKPAKETTFGPIPYLFPDQTVSVSVENLRFTLPEDEMAIVKKAVELNKPIVVAGKLQSPVRLDIDLSFENAGGQKVMFAYSHQYVFPLNRWAIESPTD
jgi:hypothetical protein